MAVRHETKQDRPDLIEAEDGLSARVDPALSTYGYEIAMDVIGPFVPDSVNGNRYVLLVHEKASRTVWQMPLRSKSDVQAKKVGETLKRDMLIPTQNVHSVYRLKTDGAREFLSLEFVDNVVRALGITDRRVTAPESSYQNAEAERAIRTVTESAAAIMAERGVPDYFWEFAYDAAVEIRDMLPCEPNHGGMSPRQARHVLTTGTPAPPDDISWWRVPFSVVAFLDPPERSRRYLGRGSLGLFVGYRRGSKGYKVIPFNARTHKYLPSHVIFVPPSRIYFDEYGRMPLNTDYESNLQSQALDFNTVANIPSQLLKFEIDEVDGWNQSGQTDDKHQEIKSDDITSNPNGAHDEPDHEPKATVRPARSGGKTVRFPDDPVSQVRSVRRPSWYYEDVGVRSHLDMAFAVANDERISLVTVGTIPKTLKQATNHRFREQWMKAVDLETKTLTVDFKVFGDPIPIGDLPKGAKMMYHKWVFAVKSERGSDGVEYVTKFKARLCAVGSGQREGVDYDPDSISSPTPAWDSFRMILALAAKYGMHIMVLDVSSAYLHAKMDKLLYMTGLPWLADGVAVPLLLCLYGTKQAGGLWHTEMMHTVTRETGLKQSLKDE